MYIFCLKTFFIISLLVALFSQAEEIHFYTENYPPFNFRDGVKASGISVEILIKIHQKMGKSDDVKIHFAPWARSYHNALQLKNAAVFSTTRIDDREGLFKWVGPIVDNNIVIVGKKARNFSIKLKSDLMGYKIGAVRYDIGELVLKRLGMPEDQMVIVTLPEQAARLLKLDRIDLWVYGWQVAKEIQKKLDLDTAKYEVIFNYGSAGKLYYAFNKDIDDKVIEKYQQALDLIKTRITDSGKTEYELILEKYGYTYSSMNVKSKE